MDNLHLFAQIVNLIPRSDVEKEAKRHASNKGASKLDTWTHLVSMLFCHLGNCLSLRDITNGVRSASGNLNHLGVRAAPSRNALSYQNRNRDWTVWRDIYMRLHKSLGQLAGGGRIAKGVAKHNVASWIQP